MTLSATRLSMPNFRTPQSPIPVWISTFPAFGEEDADPYGNFFIADSDSAHNSKTNGVPSNFAQINRFRLMAFSNFFGEEDADPYGKSRGRRFTIFWRIPKQNEILRRMAFLKISLRSTVREISAENRIFGEEDAYPYGQNDLAVKTKSHLLNARKSDRFTIWILPLRRTSHLQTAGPLRITTSSYLLTVIH